MPLLKRVAFFFAMNEFRFLSYHTEYSCTGTYNKEMCANACFAGVFSRVHYDSDIVYTIHLYSGIDFCTKYHYSNACLFSKHEIRNHLRQLKGIYPFGYRVLEKSNNEGQVYYEVKLHLNNVPATFHKYVLTWLRYTYEYPYNVILKDTYRLKKDSMFRFESIANIFNVVSNCYPDDVNDIHSIAENIIHKPLRKCKLCERIRKADRLEEIYNFLYINAIKLPKQIEGFECKDLEYWSEELFELKKSTYIEMYKTIKSKRR